MNQSFIRPRTAGGRSLAITTSMFFSYQTFNVFRHAFKEFHVQHAFAECFGDGVFIVGACQGERQGKGEINAQFCFVEVGQIIDEGERTAGVNEAQMRRVARLCTQEQRMP